LRFCPSSQQKAKADTATFVTVESRIYVCTGGEVAWHMPASGSYTRQRLRGGLMISLAP